MKEFTPEEFIEAAKQGPVDYDPIVAITDPIARKATIARLTEREAAHVIGADLAEP